MNTDIQTVYNPVRWGRASQALVALARDTQRTDCVFEIITALSGSSFEKTYRAFLASSHGQTLLRDRPSLMKVLEDRSALRRMPRGSLGREYLAFMEAGELTADGLVESQAEAVDPNADAQLDPDRRYVADRLRDMHDLWHVLTGYGRDDTGEIANLWFSVGQFGNPGMAFIAAAGMLGGWFDPALSWYRYCFRAWRRGRAAVPLVSAPLEQMLCLPIAEARRLLGIEAPERAHPHGIRAGYRADGQLGAPAHARLGHRFAPQAGSPPPLPASRLA